MNIEALNKNIVKCKLCNLYKTCSRILPGQGAENIKVMIVGESPGKDEDRTGKLFVGRSGQILEEMLRDIDLSKNDVYITNVLKCNPPKNRNPYPMEIDSCRPWLEKEIELINPEIIVLLGKFSSQTFFPNLFVTKSHGEIMIKCERSFFIMYHPAVAFYDMSKKQLLKEDFRKLKKYLIKNKII